MDLIKFLIYVLLFLEIYGKKQHYLSHLKLSNYKGKKLFQYDNNLIPYIIKRFSSDIKSNLYNKYVDPVKSDYILQDKTQKVIQEATQTKQIQVIDVGKNDPNYSLFKLLELIVKLISKNKELKLDENKFEQILKIKN